MQLQSVSGNAAFALNTFFSDGNVTKTPTNNHTVIEEARSQTSGCDTCRAVPFPVKARLLIKEIITLIFRTFGHSEIRT
jgi:hypothetical protein